MYNIFNVIRGGIFFILNRLKSWIVLLDKSDEMYNILGNKIVVFSFFRNDDDMYSIFVEIRGRFSLSVFVLI